MPFKNSIEGKIQPRLVFKNYDHDMTSNIRWRWWQLKFMLKLPQERQKSLIP